MGKVWQGNTGNSAMEDPNSDLVGDQDHFALVDRVSCILRHIKHPTSNFSVRLSPARPPWVGEHFPYRRVRNNSFEIEPGSLEIIQAFREALINVDGHPRCERQRSR